jgi:hypothetical protein
MREKELFIPNLGLTIPHFIGIKPIIPTTCISPEFQPSNNFSQLDLWSIFGLYFEISLLD